MNYEKIERIIINDVMPESRDVMFCLLDVARAAERFAYEPGCDCEACYEIHKALSAVEESDDE